MPAVALADLFDRVAFCDPASGRKAKALRQSTARSAIIVVAADSLSRVFVLHAWADRCSPSALASRLLETNEAWHPRVFGIEDNAMQTLFAELVIRDAKRLQQRVAFRGVTQPTSIDKDYRITTVLQPVIGQGRLLVRDDQRELRHELEAFPTGKTKDLVDALASAVQLLRRRPRKAEATAEREAHLRYLRESGAPPSYIEQVAEEVA